MMFRRFAANVQGRNWGAFALEFVMVILGVFLGIVAANWNEDRLDKKQTRQLLGQLRTELGAFQSYLANMDRYYAVVDVYADRATAGWSSSETVDDNDFVIAAYQASQITAAANSGEVWSTVFGADRLRDLDDRLLRENLARLMTYDYNLVDLRAVSTRYREEVRKVIPADVQSAIRERCGDRPMGMTFTLPPSCDLEIPAEAARRTAIALRQRPELAGELNWHRAAVANQLSNIAQLRTVVDAVVARLKTGNER